MLRFIKWILLWNPRIHHRHNKFRQWTQLRGNKIFLLPVSKRFVLILFSNLILSPRPILFQEAFITKMLQASLTSIIRATCITLHWGRIQIADITVMYFWSACTTEADWCSMRLYPYQRWSLVCIGFMVQVNVARLHDPVDKYKDGEAEWSWNV